MARRWFLDRSHHVGIPSVNLRRLLPEARFIGCRELEVSGCAADHRRLEPGQAYVSLHSPDATSATRSLHQALEKGASAVIVEQPTEAAGSLQVVVPDARVAHARISHALAGYPSQRLRVFAVMGHHGRTAAAWTLRSLLEAAGQRPGYVGRAGWSDGTRFYPPAPTPIEPANLAEMLAAMEEGGCACAVIEVDPEAASNRLLEAVTLEGAVFTPLGVPETNPTSREQHRRDHARIARLVRPGGTVVVTGDDREASLLSATNLHATRLVCSARQSEAADLSWKAADEGPKGSSLQLFPPGSDPLQAEVGWMGAANHAGAAAAVMLAHACRLDRHAILSGLEAASAIPGALELLSLAQGIPIWTDQAASPVELATSLDSLRAHVTGRLFCVLCTPHQNRLHLVRPLAEACEHLADQVILTLDSPSTPEEPVRVLRAWFHKAGRVRVEPDREQAIAAALQIARPGDGILIVGPARSWLRATGNNHAFIPVDDREIIRRYLTAQPALRSA